MGAYHKIQNLSDMVPFLHHIKGRPSTISAGNAAILSCNVIYWSPIFPLLKGEEIEAWQIGFGYRYVTYWLFAKKYDLLFCNAQIGFRFASLAQHQPGLKRLMTACKISWDLKSGTTEMKCNWILMAPCTAAGCLNESIHCLQWRQYIDKPLLFTEYPTFSNQPTVKPLV